MKKYGLYLAYPVAIDFKGEGLGHHLANFLKASLERNDINFVIACPSWLQASLYELIYDFQIGSTTFEFISPKKRRCTSVLSQLHALFFSRHKLREYKNKLFARLSGDRRVSTIFIFLFLGIIFSPVLIFFVFFMTFLKIVFLVFNKIKNKILMSLEKFKIFQLIRNFIRSHCHFSLNPLFYLKERYQKFCSLDKRDTILKLNQLINERKDIVAWYCPMPFWPDFNQIKAPKLLCVPDLVLQSFPVGFSLYVDDLRNHFALVIQAIEHGKYFVSYSQFVKFNTLVKDYHVNAADIFVIPHAANSFNHLINVAHYNDTLEVKKSFCISLFSQALHTAKNHHYASQIYSHKKLKFIFYASQARPHKNMLSLLKVYDYLLKRRYISHKLILTAHPDVMPELNAYVSERRLENDVLWLHGISSQQLAACYHLADLAVNPSLSEGACPFTLTEALSVDTPVVMARINVTEEVITDPALQDMMLFDPYDWKDMADKIEWGLKNRETLLAAQKPLYNELAKRTWKHVVDDYVKILDQISEQHEARSC